VGNHKENKYKKNVSKHFFNVHNEVQLSNTADKCGFQFIIK